MRIMKGISASPGISIGKVFLYSTQTLNFPSYSIEEDEVDGEITRFNNAIERVRRDLVELAEKTRKTAGKKDLEIIETHLMMIEDPDLKSQITQGIAEECRNAEHIVEHVISMMTKTLEDADDEYLKERVVDLIDIQSRILHHLMYIERTSLVDIKEEVILVAQNLLPSEVLTMNKKYIKGIVLDAGGKTSHTAILARSFEIPAVLGLSNVSKKVRNGNTIVVDGNQGTVILRPGRSVIDTYKLRLEEWIKHEKDLLGLHNLPAETKDGHKVMLMANIEIPEEVNSAVAHGASGIGLYRSEFLFLRPGEVASEEEQFDAYAYVLKHMKGKGPVTIRTIDVGGDKVIPGLKDFDEENPILGWRAVRFCLSRKDIFRIQLRAMLRASVYGSLKIMFPMISGGEELENVLQVLEEVKESCRQEKIPFDEEIQVGSMIEVPSAALISDIIAKKVDFLSIGTNDLIQYTIAVDRGNEKIAYLYQPFHPGVLRFLKMIIDNGHQFDIPVAMCGEMASDPIFTVLLLGLGLDEFSMSPAAILEVKKIIRSVTITEARELAETIMDMDTYTKIDEYVRKWLNERFDIFST
ncbi:MAG: phosphoenolpyruvate--protein phosphotransferase [Spirochaetales bacterium]|nr:phosphoenolpyruvate--protein phosphotransferase [Spirochaetales bacterium]